MVAFAGRETTDKPMLDGAEVLDIHADLTSGLDTTGKRYLAANAKLCFMGTTKVGDFDMPAEKAAALLKARDADAPPNSDVVRPIKNGSDLVRENSDRWIVDFGVERLKESASKYRLPFQHVVENVKEERLKNNEPLRRAQWWLFARPRPDFREATRSLSRYIGTARIAKHRLFVWLDSVVLPDSKVIALAFDDDYRFGVLQSRAHEVWTLATCGWHGKGNDATYNPTECFETFPFPFPDDLSSAVRRDIFVEPSAKNDPSSVGATSSEYAAPDGAKSKPTAAHYKDAAPDGAAVRAEHRAAIAAAAQELNEWRERWLHPPEWTRTEYLEFPANADGPWARYVECGDLSPLSAPDRLAGQAGPRPAARGRAGARSSSDGDKSPAESADKSAHSKIGLARYPRLVPRDADCAAQLKKRTLTNLYNERPAWLALAHKRLDAAVAAAYGWPADLSGEQILEKLLALNLERAAEEAKAAKVKKPKTSRAKREDELL